MSETRNAIMAARRATASTGSSAIGRPEKSAIGGRIVVFGGGLWFLAAIAWWPAVPPTIGTASAAGVCRPAPEHLATAAGDPVGGIGGTGRAADDGVGGEGGIGGTGIVGTITGFASVCVNGIEVHYDNAVPVAENGKPSSVRALAVGQVVAVDTVPGPRGTTARRIEVMHALEGPVTRQDGKALEVMGAAVVAADPATRNSIAGVRAGEWVQVSGHRDAAGRWVATRVARIDARSEATALGVADGPDRIAGVPIEGATGTTGSGAVRLVRGEWAAGPSGESGGGRLRVRQALEAPASSMLSRSERLIVETRVRDATSGRVRTGHPEIDSALAGQSVREGELIRVRAARSADGKIVTERVERSTGRADDGAARPKGKEGVDSGGQRGSDRESDRDRSRDEGGADRGGRERSEPDRDRGDRREREDRNDRGDRNDRSERNERNERNERTDRPERIEKVERAERPDRPTRD